MSEGTNNNGLSFAQRVCGILRRAWTWWYRPPSLIFALLVIAVFQQFLLARSEENYIKVLSERDNYYKALSERQNLMNDISKGLAKQQEFLSELRDTLDKMQAKGELNLRQKISNSEEQADRLQKKIEEVKQKTPPEK